MNYRRMFLIGLSILALSGINWTVAEAEDGKGIFKVKVVAIAMLLRAHQNLKALKTG